MSMNHLSPAKMGFVKLSSVSLLLLPSSCLPCNSIKLFQFELKPTARCMYVVYMGARQHEDANLVTASHHDMLALVLGSKDAAVESMLYSYKHGFSGFSATLTESQAKQISRIWPESGIFNDLGYSLIPSRWKGICQEGEEFNASHYNRKIIGARWYARGIDCEVLQSDYLSPRDIGGHDTHIASTAAGSIVSNVNVKGLGARVARRRKEAGGV